MSFRQRYNVVLTYGHWFGLCFMFSTASSFLLGSLRIPPYSITAESNIKITRGEEILANEGSSWLLSKFLYIRMVWCYYFWLFATSCKFNKSINVNCFNLLTPICDQDRISLYNINAISSRQVMRININ